MSWLTSAEVDQLVRSLYEERSPLDLARGLDPRIATLSRIAQSYEARVIPDLMPLLAADETVAPHVGRTIAVLAQYILPGHLFWLDEQVRRSPYPSYRRGAWALAPDAVPRLAASCDFDTRFVGLLASHPNGFVRAAALDLLAQRHDGQEIAFLSLRANDWVEPVAARATALLLDRLRSDNRHAVVDALPFIVRVLGQRRRDHDEIERALTSVLLSDGGEEAVARGTRSNTAVRRKMFALLTGAERTSRRLIDAALNEADAITRVRAIRSVAADPDIQHRAATLERFLHDDPDPAVRRLALAVLAEHLPQRLAAMFPEVLLDRTASVRALARFVAASHSLAVVPRDVYVGAVATSVGRSLSAAIEGLGETGSPSDADVIARFLSEDSPGVRRSALRAIAKLDPERAGQSAIAALTDAAPSVRSAAVDILSTNASRVDFEVVSRRVRSLSDPTARRKLLRVFIAAPKWDAPAFLLEALNDLDEEVRAAASRLIERWIERFNRNQTQPAAEQLQRIGGLLDSVASRLPEQTEKRLRFSIKSV